MKIFPVEAKSYSMRADGQTWRS